MTGDIVMKSIIKSILVLSLLGGLVACTPKPVEEDPFDPLTTFVVSAVLGNDVTKSINLALDEADVSAILKEALWDRDDAVLSQSSTIVVTVTDKLGDRYAFSSGRQSDSVIVTRKNDGKQFGFKLTSGTVEDLRVLIQSIGSDPVLVKPQYLYKISVDGIYDPSGFIELDQSYNSVINLFPESILIETNNSFNRTGLIDYVLQVNQGKFITVYREGVPNEEFPFEPGWRYVSIGPYPLCGSDCPLYLVSESDLGINSNLFYYPSVDGPDTLNLSELNMANYTIEQIKFGILRTGKPSFGMTDDDVLNVLINAIGDGLTQTERPHVADFWKMVTIETNLGLLYINQWGFILDEDPLTPGVAYYERPQQVDLLNLLVQLEYFTQIPIDHVLPDLTPETLFPYTPDPITLTGTERTTLIEALDVSKWTRSNLIPWEPLMYDPKYCLMTEDGAYLYFAYPRYEGFPMVVVGVDGEIYYVSMEHFLSIKAVIDAIETN